MVHIKRGTFNLRCRQMLLCNKRERENDSLFYNHFPLTKLSLKFWEKLFVLMFCQLCVQIKPSKMVFILDFKIVCIFGGIKVIIKTIQCYQPVSFSWHLIFLTQENTWRLLSSKQLLTQCVEIWLFVIFNFCGIIGILFFFHKK